MRYRACLSALLPTMILAGCETTAKTDPIEIGRAALTARDYATAEKNFDAFLKQTPNGPRSAEAYYLKGHAIQDAPSDDKAEAQSRLQQARLAYIDALKVGTDSRALEGLIRASLADVAFWQEDYAVSAEQGLAAYPLLEEPPVRAMALYRAGLSYQRQGKFADGDRTLKLVTQYHPNTAAAERAKQRVGIKAFNVRIPLATQAAVSGAMASLTRQGFAPAVTPGESAVSVGPFQTYQQADAVRARLTPQYAKAAVVP